MLLALLLAQAATAHRDIYLSCDIPGQRDVQLSANEANGTVSLTTAGGTSERLPAVFTAKEVRFSDDTNSYVVSRTDLTIQDTVMFNGKPLPITVPGKCTLSKAPKRAF